MSKQTIGIYYDAQRFDPVIFDAARELVRSTMGADAEGEKGLAFAEQATANLKESFASLSIDYYQALEAFADGKSMEAYLKNSDVGTDVMASLINGSFIDLVLACGDGLLSVKNERAAMDYYRKRFPEAQTDQAHFEARKEQEIVDQSTERIQEKEGIREMLENFELRRAALAYEKANAEYEDWLKPDSVEERGGSEHKRFQKICAELDRKSQRLGYVKKRSILSAQKRFEEGRITQDQLKARIDQIESGDPSLHMPDGSEWTLPTEETVSLSVTAEPSVPKTEEVKKHPIDFKKLNIEIDRFVPQMPTAHAMKEKKAVHDGIEPDNEP